MIFFVRAEPIITPSEKAATSRAWAGDDIPKPQYTGHGDTLRASESFSLKSSGSSGRVPVTPKELT